MTACGELPRLTLAGAFALSVLLVGPLPTLAQNTNAAPQHDVGGKTEGAAAKGEPGKAKPSAKGKAQTKQKAKSKAAEQPKKKAKPRPKPKPKPRLKPKPKPEPKPAPQALPTPEPQPAWRSMPAPQPMPLPKPKTLLTAAQAVERHNDGLAAERGGDDHGALRAFLEAAEAGHGPAQLKVAEIYDRGNAAVKRDYAAALVWYQRARESGMSVPKPHVFPAGR